MLPAVEDIQGEVEVQVIAPEKEAVKEPDYLIVQRWYTSQIGVVEKTGKNDGKEVEGYLKHCNLGKGYAWCSCFVLAGFNSAGVKTTITAWSPTAENKKNIVYKNNSFNYEPRPADVVTFWYSNLGRIAHAGFYDKRVNDRFYDSVEGNTSSGSYSRDGEGVYKKRRSFNATNSISRWTQD